MQEFFNSNEHRNYPFADDCVKDLPTAVVADLRLTVPASVSEIWLSQALYTGATVSLLFSSASGPVAAVAVAVADTGPKYPAFAVEPLVTGVKGWVVFGSGLGDLGPFSLSWGSVADAGLAAGAVCVREQAPVTAFVSDVATGRSDSATGVVEIRGRSGVLVSADTGANAVVLGLDKSVRQAMTPFSDTGEWTPRLRSILGVCPDDEGTITLRFREAP